MKMRNTLKFTLVSLSIGLVSACGSAPKYACKASPGLGCISVKGVYDKLNKGELNTKKPSKVRVKEKVPSNDTGIDAQGTLVTASAPTYVAPKVMRIWIGPWADKNGVYHSQSYVYKVVSKGSWLNPQNDGAIPSEIPKESSTTYYSSIHTKKSK